jgi:hypothetical protein
MTATKMSLKDAASKERLLLTGLSKLQRTIATPISQARVIIIFAGVAVAAPLGAAMKMSKYKKPAILALIRGDATAMGFVISAVQALSTPHASRP